MNKVVMIWNSLAFIISAIYNEGRISIRGLSGFSLLISTLSCADIQEHDSHQATALWLTPPFAPFVYSEEGELKGVYYSVLQKLMAGLGYELKVKETPLRRVYTSLHDGIGDITIVPTEVWNSERNHFKGRLICNIPFSILELGLYARKGSLDRPLIISDIVDKDVYTNQLGNPAIRTLFSDSQKFVKTNDTPVMLRDLFLRRADLILNYKLLIAHYAGKADQLERLEEVIQIDYRQEHLLCFSGKFIESQSEDFVDEAKNHLNNLKSDLVLEARLNEDFKNSSPIKLKKFLQ